MTGISFFIPAYNCALTIVEAVESILKTNFTIDDELIIVNDHSVDNTSEILAALKEKYQLINILSHNRNKGGAVARNTAVDHAKNKLLFCLDSDNVLAPDSIAPLREYLIECNADVASFQYQLFFSVDKFRPDYIWELPAGVFDNQNYFTGKNSPGQHGNYLFTKRSWEIAGGYAEGAGALDTITFGLRQAITGSKAVILKDTFYYHRLVHATSYWMRDAEANLWSVSPKVAHALFPFYDRIEEGFLTYMLGRGKYTWYYNLKNRPLPIVEKGTKDQFYLQIHQKISKRLYPRLSIIKHGIIKLMRIRKKMIAVKLEGRLGNQLFQYAFAYATAKKLNTWFYLDKSIETLLLSRYFNIERDFCTFLDDNIFSITGFKNLFSYYARRYYYHLLSRSLFLKSVTFSDQLPPAEQLNNLKNGYIYSGFFQSEQYFINERETLSNLFTIKPKYCQSFQDIFNSIPKAFTYVAVHVRRGDYVDLALALEPAYYHAAINQIVSKENFYIFISDDPDYVESEFAHIPNKYISKNDAITDLQFLMHSDICIISNSTFSWWGAWLNNKTEKKIYCPVYFMGKSLSKEVPQGIYPPNWIQIDY